MTGADVLAVRLPLDTLATIEIDELPSFVVDTHCPGGRLILGRGVEQW